MLTKIEKTELTKELVALFNAGEVDKAATLVKERWLIFSHLPSALRDNDDIAYAAVTANMQAWKGLSPRLINDINFFKTTFNKTNTHRIWFEKPRDMLFMTAYANKNRIYGYLIPSEKIREQYAHKKGTDFEKESDAAKKLIKLVEDWKEWFPSEKLSDEVACICFLYEQVPGFKLFSYAYAFNWVSTSRNMDHRGNYV